MGSAICGGARYVLRTEPDDRPDRYCYGERKRQPGTWELRSDTPGDEPSWYEPIWLYRCTGCGQDRRALG
jgi:hypothetical protein